LLCVAILVLATTAQAAHVCCSRLDGAVVTEQQVHVGTTGVRVCLFCLMASSVGILVLFISALAGSTIPFAAAPPKTTPILFIRPFSLYVRPPPAF